MEVMSEYNGLRSKSSRKSEGNQQSNYLRGSSLSKGAGSRLVLAGSGLDNMSPDVKERLVGGSLPKL